MNNIHRKCSCGSGIKARWCCEKPTRPTRFTETRTSMCRENEALEEGGKYVSMRRQMSAQMDAELTQMEKDYALEDHSHKKHILMATLPHPILVNEVERWRKFLISLQPADQTPILDNEVLSPITEPVTEEDKTVADSVRAGSSATVNQRKIQRKIENYLEELVGYKKDLDHQIILTDGEFYFDVEIDEGRTPSIGKRIWSAVAEYRQANSSGEPISIKPAGRISLIYDLPDSPDLEMVPELLDKEMINFFRTGKLI